MRLILIADDIFLLVDLKTLCNSLIESALLCCILCSLRQIYKLV